jgi:hypothetical protein
MNKRSARAVYSANEPGAKRSCRPEETLLIRMWCTVSIRALMALVLIAGLALWLSISAFEVYSARETHMHTYVDTGAVPRLTGWNRPAPFWPRYVRKLLGRPWRRQPICGPTPGAEEELCEFAHPEMAHKFGGKVAYDFSSEQGDRLEAIENERAGRP